MELGEESGNGVPETLTDKENSKKSMKKSMNLPKTIETKIN